MVLPDGKVMVVGGQSYPAPFTDTTAVLTAELWDAATRRFTAMAPMAVPRNYHSVALLLPDGRVCRRRWPVRCRLRQDHPDAQILSPDYLFSPNGQPSPRPAITYAPSELRSGGHVAVPTNRPVTRFSLVRLSSITHSINTDQRRVPLPVVARNHTRTRWRLRRPRASPCPAPTCCSR